MPPHVSICRRKNLCTRTSGAMGRRDFTPLPVSGDRIVGSHVTTVTTVTVEPKHQHRRDGCDGCLRVISPGKVRPSSPSANLPEVMHRDIAKMVTRTGIERGLQAKRLMTIFRECFWPTALNYKSAAVNSNQPQIKWVLPAKNPMRGATARDSRSV